MVPAKRITPAAGSILVVVYCVVTCCVAVGALTKPAYNWDMLPYMGVVLSYDNGQMNAIHQQVYATAREQVPAVYYNRMVDPSNTYRSAVAQNPAMFGAQFPFYIVKPLYTRISWMLYATGVSLINATVWPSVASWWGCSLLLFFWMRKYWVAPFAFAGSFLVMLSPPLLTVATLSTPDALSGLLLFTAVYLLAEQKKVVQAMLFFLLAIFARLDNIIALFCCLPVMVTINRHRGNMRHVNIVTMVGLSVLACWLIAWPATAYGWSAGYYPTFVKHLNTSYTAGGAFDPTAYGALAKTQLVTGLYFSFIPFFLFISLAVVYPKHGFSWRMLSIEQALTLTFIAIVVLRFILQPVVADRFYIPWYLCAAVFLVKKQSLVRIC